MLRKIVVFAVLAYICIVTADNLGDKPGFFLTLPPYLIYGREENVCLSLHNVTVPTNATIKLQVKGSQYVTQHNIDKEYLCFHLQVPLLNETESLPVSIDTYIENNGTTLLGNNSDPIMITFPNRSAIFIQTDKHIYTPDDLLKFRILVLNDELLPGKEKISLIRLKNINGVTISAWNNVETEKGFVDFEYHLPEDSLEGKWQIEADGAQTYFDIIKRVPAFKVYLRNPKVLRYNENDSVVINVCALYLYNQPVKGNANLTIDQVRPVTYYNYFPEITPKVTERKELTNACANFVISMSNFYPTAVFPPKLMIKVAVTEDESGHTKEVKSQLQFQYYSIFVEDDKETEHFRPGIQTFFQMKFNYLQNARVGETLNVSCKIASEKLGYTETYASIRVTGKNTICFTLPPLRREVEWVKISINETPYKKLIYSARSATSNYLYVRHMKSQTSHCPDVQNFVVYYNVNDYNIGEEIMFYYVIKSNSKMIGMGSVAGEPKQAQTIDEASLPNVICTKNNFTDYDAKIGNISISLRLNRKIFWRYQILVYCILPNGNIVADKRNVELQPCLPNKVDVTWQQQIYPGSEATLNIATSPYSLCSISATDEENGLRLANEFGASKLLKEVTTEYKYDTSYELPACEKDQMLRKRRKRRFRDGSYGYITYDLDAITVLKAFGVSVVTNYRIQMECWYREYWDKGTTGHQVLIQPHSTTYNADLFQNAARAASIESTQQNYWEQNTDVLNSVSSILPQSWLWELISTGFDGKAKVNKQTPRLMTNWTTNVVCVSPTEGLGISNFNFLTVVPQHFFIDVIIPYEVTRGEDFRVNVKIFNYLSNKISFKVELLPHEFLDTLDYNPKDGPKHVEIGDTGDVSFRVRAKRLGKLNVTIVATASRSDVIAKTLLVVPEGFPVEVTKSALICSNETQGQNVTWYLELPHNSTNYVPSSLESTITLNSDIFVPIRKNLRISRIEPSEPGIRMMAKVYSNILVLEYTNATSSYNDAFRAKAIENIRIGCQQIVSRIKAGDSVFSEFSFLYHSMLLPSYLLIVLSKSKPYCSVEDDVFTKITEWIFDHQSEDGCFPPYHFRAVTSSRYHKPQVHPLEGQNSTLTSYVLINLLESGIEIPKSVLSKAASCIVKEKIAEEYALSITSLALLLEKSHLTEATNRLNELKTLLFKDETVEENFSSILRVDVYMFTLSSLVHLKDGDSMAQAVIVMHWLTQKLIPRLETDSEASLGPLSKYARIIRTKQNVTIQIETDEKSVEVIVSEQSNPKLTTFKLKGTEDTVKIGISGEGCVIAQSILKYNVYAALNNTVANGTDPTL